MLLNDNVIVMSNQDSRSQISFRIIPAEYSYRLLKFEISSFSGLRNEIGNPSTRSPPPPPPPLASTTRVKMAQ